MRKAIPFVAAASALFAVAPAFGQSTVTIYGVVDAAVRVTDFKRAGVGNLQSLDSGHRNGSRWGLRGSEDLGDGLKAIFQLEQGFSLDTGLLGQGGRGFGRQAYVGLDTPYGTVAFGRIASFHGGAFDMFGEIDPFYSGFGILTYQSTFAEGGGLRTDNALMYRTPRLGGFQAGVLHSVHTDGAEPAGSGTRTKFTHVGAVYRDGNLHVAATASVAKFPDASNFKDQKHFYAGAAYDFKWIKLHAGYGTETAVRTALISPVGATAEGTDAKAWFLGATAPLGNGKLRVGLQKRDGKQQTIGTTAFDADRTVYGAAYEYSLSRRSLVHVSLGRSKGSGTLAPTRAATDFANRTELGLGVTHIF